jgi:hypothetical protein
MPAGDRVHDQRRAAALARHYRDAEGLSIWEISRRLGRAEAPVKAYQYDPTDANKGPSRQREAQQGVASSGLRCSPRRYAETSLPGRLVSVLGRAVQHVR